MFQCKIKAMMQSVKCGDITLRHIPDPLNPADFLTKFVGGPKLKQSLAFITNAWHRVPLP